MQIQVTIQHPKLFDIRDIPGFDGPTLWADGITINFESKRDVQRLRRVVDDYCDAILEAEIHRQAAAEVDDDSASRNGDRNHELTMALGGPVV